MKRILKFLARLYPSGWHNRYGAELDALLEDGEPRTRDAFDVLWGAIKMQMTTWSFVRITLACSLAGVFAAAAISFTIPPRYVSQTIITATSTKDAGRLSLDVLGRVAFSRESLASVIQKQKLYPGERLRVPLNDVIDKMQRDIHVSLAPLASSGKGDATSFVLKFDYPDPKVAQQVNEELVSRLVRSNLLAAVQSQSHTTLRVEHEPSLPQKPSGLNRIQLAIIGLFAGLLGGLILATILRSHHDTIVANG